MKFKDLTPTQYQQIAELADMSAESLRHVWKGRRGVSSLTAIKIEKAAKRMGLDIRRETLNDGCAACNFAKACRKTLADGGSGK